MARLVLFSCSIIMAVPNKEASSGLPVYIVIVASVVFLSLVVQRDLKKSAEACGEPDLYDCAASMRYEMNRLCTKGKHIRGWSDLDKSRFAWGRVVHKDRACTYCRGRCEKTFPRVFTCEVGSSVRRSVNE